MSAKTTQRIYNKFVLTKKIPNRFSNKVEPVVCEATEQVFAAIGNQVNVYSLKTTLQIGVLR